MSAAKKITKIPEPPDLHIDHDDEPTHVVKKEEGEGPWLVSYADLMTLLMGFFALISSMSSPDKNKFEKVREAAVAVFGGKLEKPYESLAADLKKFIDDNGLGDQVKIKTTIEGIELTFEGTMFFASGDFLVKEDAAELMTELSKVIKKTPNEYRALIEGHTDSAPIRHPIIASNWELSGLRASRIAQIFEANGFAKDKLTIIGWGENKPLVPNYDKAGEPLPENMTKNRRVVIRVYDRKFSDDPIRQIDPDAAKRPKAAPKGTSNASGQPEAAEPEAPVNPAALSSDLPKAG